MPRVGFILTNLARDDRAVVCFYNKRGTIRHHPPDLQPSRGLIEKALVPAHRLAALPPHWPLQQLPKVPLQMVIG